MIVLPVGTDETEIRRIPWVTLSLAVLCAATFTAIWPRALELEAAVQISARDVAQHYIEHPYLELEPRVQSVLLGRVLDAEQRARVEKLRENARAQVGQPDITRQQEKLRALEQKLLDELDGHPMRRFGLVPAAPALEDWLSHMFMHGSWGHLFGNLMVLLIAGYCLEERWGRGFYGVLYALGGIAAAALFCFRYPNADVPLIGASGAISAVIGAFLVRFGSTRIHFFYWVLLVFRGTFKLPAWLVTLVWAGNELGSAYLIDFVAPEAMGGSVAHWAHLGGFAFGSSVALAVRAARAEQRWFAPRIDASVSGYHNALLIRALELGNESAERAFEWLRAELPKQPGHRDAALYLWDLAVKLKRTGLVVAELTRLLREDVQRERWKEACGLLRELHAQAAGARLDPLILVRLGLGLATCGRSDDARLAFERALDALPEGKALPLAVRAVRALSQIDRALAQRAAERSLAARDLAEPAREELQRLLDSRKVETFSSAVEDPNALDLDDLTSEPLKLRKT